MTQTLEQRVEALEAKNARLLDKIEKLAAFQRIFMQVVAIEFAFRAANPDEWARGFISDLRSEVNYPDRRSQDPDWPNPLRISEQVHAQIDRFEVALVASIRLGD